MGVLHMMGRGVHTWGACVRVWGGYHPTHHAQHTAYAVYVHMLCIYTVPASIHPTHTHHHLQVLYARLFDWIVAATNRKITTIGSATTTPNSIGILDIYGFESFVENSFEQLCINLANEKLQQQFNATIFKAEQQEYVQEGIDWTHVEFVDNQDCLDLLEGGVGGKSSLGVFPLIDEACRMPKATYEVGCWGGVCCGRIVFCMFVFCIFVLYY